MVLYQKGEYRAFTELYERYAPRIHGFVCSKISNQEESADLTQQIFLKIHRNRTGYSDQFPVIAWFFTIARNTLIDHFRQKKNVPIPIANVNHMPETSVPVEAEHPLLLRAREAIDKLPDTQRALLNLRFQSGLSFEEISENLGIPSQTLRKRVSRLISNLKKGGA